jgi:hypothetical protein
MPQRKPGPIRIAILGGDLLVGRSLEAALRGIGYDVRFLNGAFLDGSATDQTARLLVEVELIVFTPRMRAGRRRAFLDLLRETPATAAVPVLELATTLDEVRAEQAGVGLVAWPCPTEELARRIEAVLLINEAYTEADGSLGDAARA